MKSAMGLLKWKSNSAKFLLEDKYLQPPKPAAFCYRNLGLNLSYSPPREICWKIGNTTASSIILTARGKELSSAAIFFKDQIITKKTKKLAFYGNIIFCRCWKDAIKLFWNSILVFGEQGCWEATNLVFQVDASPTKPLPTIDFYQKNHTLKIHTFEALLNQRLNMLK